MARIYDLWEGSLNKRKMSCLVPYCGKDCYRAHVLQHPHRFIQIHITHISSVSMGFIMFSLCKLHINTKCQSFQIDLKHGGIPHSESEPQK